MGILLAFVPFIAFAIASRFLGPTPGLIMGAIVSVGLLLREGLRPNRSPKTLEIGTAILFGSLTLLSLFWVTPGWGILAVRLRVDGGLLLIVLISIALRRPFTLQYAREQVPREFWNRPEFLRVNYTITAVWALAFVLVVAADVALIYVPGLAPAIPILVTILALAGAFTFTSWYPKRVRAALAAAGQPR